MDTIETFWIETLLHGEWSEMPIGAVRHERRAVRYQQLLEYNQGIPARVIA
jgi:hypothetical protein